MRFKSQLNDILTFQSQFYCMVDAAFPVGFRMGISKVVVMAVVLLCQDACPSHNRLAVNSVHTGHIQGYWVKRCKHTQMFGTIGTSFSEWQSQLGETSDDQADMEVWSDL